MMDMPKEINLPEHNLVPKHEIMKKEEVDEILKKFNITKGQLPKTKLKDPLIKFMGAKEGDVLRIMRKSPTAGESVYYRLVVR